MDDFIGKFEKSGKKKLKKFVPAENRNTKVPLNVSLKKNLEMISRSRESSLKRENQQKQKDSLHKSIEDNMSQNSSKKKKVPVCELGCGLVD